MTQECWEQYWTSPGGSTPQDTNYTAACLPSRKLYKLDEPNTQDIAGEAKTNSSVMYPSGPPHMARAKAGRPARTYIQQLYEDTGCNHEDLPKAMNDREESRERIRDIRAGGTTLMMMMKCMFAYEFVCLFNFLRSNIFSYCKRKLVFYN